jgi:hypothetical protein
MARCRHCGEPIADGQEFCYACGQKARTRSYRAAHHVNPLIFVAAGLLVVVVLGGLWWIRANASWKQAALSAEEEVLHAQDSARRAAHRWQDALRAAANNPEARALTAKLNDVEARFQSVRLRVAEHPSKQQEDITRRFQSGLDRLRQNVVILASSPDVDKQPLRDSIQSGMLRLEDLTREIGNSR